MYVPTPQPPLTAEAQELADEIARTARDYRVSHPNLGARDVDAAFRAARRELGNEASDTATRTRLAIAGVLVAVLLAGLMLAYSTIGGGDVPTLLYPALGIAVVGLTVAVAAKSTRQDGADPRLWVAVVIGLLAAAAGLALLLLRSSAAHLPPG